MPQFKKSHYSLYLSVFTDLAYVIDNQNSQNNDLSKQTDKNYETWTCEKLIEEYKERTNYLNLNLMHKSQMFLQ